MGRGAEEEKWGLKRSGRFCASSFRQPSTQLSTTEIWSRVAITTARIADLGSWPEHISEKALLDRIPVPGHTASGFDAGIACALDLIPRSRQRLAARLHAAYTPQAVAQIRAEAKEMEADAETTWWLAACSVCQEQDLDEAEFMNQLQAFQELAADPEERVRVARAEFARMTTSFEIDELGVALSTTDGGIQGAYIAGHEVAAMYLPQEELYLVGTLHPSLGLEDFDWEQPAYSPQLFGSDDYQSGRSGPVHGSRQFVKCTNRREYQKVIARVRDYLGPNALEIS